MAFEQLRAEIEQLVQQMENEPEDIHELHARIRSKLNELKATGMPLPDDLVALEKRLDREERRPSAQVSETEERRPARTGRARPAKTARRPAKAAKKTARAGAKKSKRPAAKASRRTGGRTGATKAKRSPARATAKAGRAGGARKARRSAGRRR
jgi:hypothetical protein